MKVVYKGKNEKVNDCVEFINDLFEADFFLKSVADKDSFTHTEYEPRKVAALMKDDENETVVKLYKSFNPWTRANAHVSPKFENTLFLNTRKLWRNREDIINTIVHECVHVVDFSENGIIDFGHGDNYSKGKENSAPYWIGELAKKIYLDSLESEIEIESHEIDENLIVD
nr:hypothetical protein [uncultured Draconibacterium sp.]